MANQDEAAEIFAKMLIHEPRIKEYMEALKAKRISAARPQIVIDHGQVWGVGGQFPVGGTPEAPVFAIVEEILDTGAEIEFFMRATSGTAEAPKTAFLTYTVGSAEVAGIVKLWNLDGWIKHRARLSRESLYNFAVAEGIIIDTESCARCDTKNDPDFVYCKKCGEPKDDEGEEGDDPPLLEETPPNGSQPVPVTT